MTIHFHKPALNVTQSVGVWSGVCECYGNKIRFSLFIFFGSDRYFVSLWLTIRLLLPGLALRGSVGLVQMRASCGGAHNSAHSRPMQSSEGPKPIQVTASSVEEKSSLEIELNSAINWSYERYSIATPWCNSAVTHPLWGFTPSASQMET